MRARCEGKNEYVGPVSALGIVAQGRIARRLRWSDSMLIGWSLWSLLRCSADDR